MQPTLSVSFLGQMPPVLSSSEPVRQGPPHALAHYQIIRRNGSVVPFEPQKITVALLKAFLAVRGTQSAASASIRESVEALT